MLLNYHKYQWSFNSIIENQRAIEKSKLWFSAFSKQSIIFKDYKKLAVCYAFFRKFLVSEISIGGMSGETSCADEKRKENLKSSENGEQEEQQ